MENVTNGNGKKASALVAIHNEWKSNGGKVPTGKALENLKDKLRAAYEAEDKAAEALEAARAKREAVSIEVMKACGTRQPLQLGGEIGMVTPSARNERVFYKRLNQQDAI